MLDVARKMPLGTFLEKTKRVINYKTQEQQVIKDKIIRLE